MSKEEYTIESMLKRYSGKPLVQTVLSLRHEIGRTERTTPKNIGISEYDYRSYLNNTGDFLFFLQTGKIPSTIGKHGLQKFTPLLEEMVDRGELNKSVLEVLK